MYYDAIIIGAGIAELWGQSETLGDFGVRVKLFHLDNLYYI